MWAEHGRAVTGAGAGRQCFTMFHVELSARGAAGHNLEPDLCKSTACQNRIALTTLRPERKRPALVTARDINLAGAPAASSSSTQHRALPT